MELVNITGQHVFSSVIAPGNQYLPLEYLASGVYILKLGKEGKETYTKLVKK